MSLANTEFTQPTSFNETWHRRPAVKRRYADISDSTLYRWMDEGRFPKPEKIGPNTVAWRESVLAEYDADPEGWAARNGACNAA